MASYFEKIYDALADDFTLILPSEESARSILSGYVLERKKSVESTRALSFDTYLSLFHESGEKEASFIERYIFSLSFLEKHQDRLTYLISAEYGSEIASSAAYISSLIPDLERAEKYLGRNNREDILLLKKEYDEFLCANSLYEKSYISSLKPISGRFVFAFADTFMEEFFSLMKDKMDIAIIYPESSIRNEAVHVYENEKIEIRDVLLRIRKLITEDKVNAEEICITAAGYDRIRDRLEEEAYLVSLPLVFMRGENVLETPSGAFIKAAKTLYETDYDALEMKAFLLNASIPFKDEKEIRDFVYEISSRSIKKRDKKKDRYFACQKSRDGIYSRIINHVDAINTTADPAKLIYYTKSFTEAMLSESQFEGEETENYFSFIIRSLNDFASLLKNLHLPSEICRPIFPLFMKYAESITYMEKEKKDGIRVYPYGQNRGTKAAFNFIIGVNEREARIREKDARFLSDYEVGPLREEKDSTALLLDQYLSSSAVYFSSSETSFSGAERALSILKEKKISDLLSDSYKTEAEINTEGEGGSVYSVQKKAYSRAVFTSLDDKKRSEMVSGSLAFPFAFRHLSASQIDTYRKCPYQYFLSYVFNFNSAFSYSDTGYPALELGVRLHRTIERYFSPENTLHTTEALISIFSSELDLWIERKTYDRSGRIVALEKSVPSIEEDMKAFFLMRYEKGLVAIKDRIEREGGSLVFEKRMEGEISREKIVAYPDLVSYKDEGVSIFDFKSSERKDLATSVQMDVYAYLLSASVDSMSYLIFSDGKEEKKSPLERTEVEEIVSSASFAIRSGKFNTTEDKDMCTGCRLRSLCRRRFVIR